MQFSALLNEHVFLLSLTLLVQFIIGIRLAVVRGGLAQHLVYAWSLFIYFIYVLVSPYYFYETKRTYIIGTDISEYFGLGFFFNNLAVFCFIVGYWVSGRSKDKIWKAPPNRHIENPRKIISILFYVLYAIVLLNLAIGGANLEGVFLGDEVLGLGASGATYYLQNFTDSLICVLVLAYLFDMPWKTLLLWIIASFFLFSLLGFRYRIMLSLFGILFVYLYKNKMSVKKIVISASMALVFFYGIMFTTENRNQLIYRRYDRMQYNPFEFRYDRFFSQTRGALPDMAVYKLFENPNKFSKHDYGLTMFGYVFIRIIPRSIMPDKDKYYPAPQLATTIQAYDAYWAAKSGEATLSVGALYIAFGWMGIVFGHFFWALILRKFRDQIRFANKMQLATYIIIALVSFQWITRGYFPQVIDHAVYMLVPIWVLRYFSKKVKADEDNQHS